MPTGPFPPHCVQGSVGSHFFAPIARALTAARALPSARVHTIFKGISEDIDSFAAFPYEAARAETRLSKHVHCSIAWTGGFILKCSNAAADVNAPPDVLAFTKRRTVADVIMSEVPLTRDAPAAPADRADLLLPSAPAPGPPPRSVKRARSADGLLQPSTSTREAPCAAEAASAPSGPAPSRRLFVVGLAFDYCVLDSAMNAAVSGLFDGGGVYILTDATRAAHIPGLGTHGSGFLTAPEDIVEACVKYNLKLSTTAALSDTPDAAHS